MMYDLSSVADTQVVNIISAFKESKISLPIEVLYTFSFLRSWNSVDGIATRLRAAWSGVQSPVGATYSSLLQNVQTSSGAHPAY
jgi:hypothetical protein